MLILPTRNDACDSERLTWAVSDIVTLSATPYEFDAKYFAVDHSEFHPKGIYIDNSQGTAQARIQVNGVNYTWVIPQGAMGRVCIPAPWSAGSIYIQGGGPTPITFVDYPIVPGYDWPNGQPVNVAFPAIQNVDVLNFPVNQVVSGTVNVGNLPATQNVDVVNFPASQTVNGAVSVSNFPATQPVSGNVGITGNVNIGNFPATQPINGNVGITGSVNVGNFPTTQAIADSFNVTRVLTGVDFIGYVFENAGAANAICALWNPLGSGKDLFVTGFSLTTNTTGVVILGKLSAEVGVNTGNPVNKDFASAITSVAHLDTQNTNVFPNTNYFGLLGVSANIPLTVSPKSLIVVAPGTGIWLGCNSTATTLGAMFEWFEQ